MKTERLIETNAELQKSLTKENELYYGNLLVYVRTKTLLRDEKIAEQLLLEILQDILDAQKENKTAEEYFGKNPKQIADEIISTIPMNLADTIKNMLYGMVFYMAITSMPTLMLPSQGFDVLKYVFGALFFVFFAFFVLFLLGRSVYHYQSKTMKYGLFLLALVFFTIGIYFFITIKSEFIIDLSGKSGSIVLLLLAIFLSYLYYRTNDKDLWRPFIPTILFCILIGIAARVERWQSFFSSKSVRITIAILLLLTWLGSFGRFFYKKRKERLTHDK